METKRLSEISGSPEQYLRKLKRARNIPALNNDHRLLHIWFNTPPGLGVVGWTKEKIAQVHDAVVARLAGLMAAKGKTYRHKTPMKEELLVTGERKSDWLLVTGKTKGFTNNQSPITNHSALPITNNQSPITPKSLMPIRPSGEVAGREIEYEEILKYVKPFKIRSDIIQLTGGVVNNLKTQGDIEIYTEELTNADLQRILAFRVSRGLPPELAERLHFLDDHTGGPFTSRIPLGDLYFIPKKEFTRIEMQMRSAPEEIKKQAEESKEKDSISITRMFYLMKPLRGAYEDKHQTVENFMELFVAKKFPRLVSKKFDGNTFVAFKKGDSVRIFSDDGLENTEAMPEMVDAVRELKQESLIFPFELELWVSGVHYPREAVRSALSTRPEWQPYLTANIFDLLYINGRDIHKLEAPRRTSILQATFEGFQSTDGVPDANSFSGVHQEKEKARLGDRASPFSLNIVPQHIARNQAELEALIETLSSKPGSEGVVVKRGRYHLTGTADFDGGVKYHKAAWVNARILGRTETKVEGVYNYEYGLMLDRDWKWKPSDLAQEEPPVVRVGMTFNTTLEGKPGDIIQIEFETLNYILNLSEGSFRVSLWVPKVLGIEERGTFHTVGDAIDRAEAAGIAQEKWELEGAMYYDRNKIPQSLIPEKYLELLFESSVHWLGSYPKSPEDYEALWKLQDKLGFERLAKLHLTLAVFEKGVDLPVDEIKEELGTLAAFSLKGTTIALFGKERNVVCLAGEIPESISQFIDSLPNRDDTHDFVPHITLGYLEPSAPWKPEPIDLPIAIEFGEPKLQLSISEQEEARHRRDACMDCDKPPFYEVKWAEGMAHTWFCKPHFQKWARDSIKKCIADGYSADCEIDYVKEIEGKEAAKKFGQNKNPDVWQELLTQLSTSEQFQETDPYLDYPEHGKKTGLMRHAHFRGKSVHFDVRREVFPGKWLVGWTENVQKKGKITEDVDTMSEAKGICEGYSIKQGNKYLKPMYKDEHIVVEEKAPEPSSWMTYHGVVPKGEVGATAQHEGVLYIIDKGTTEWGAQKPYYHEYFDSGGKIFNGRYIVRQLENVWDELTGVYRTVWMAWYADDPTPYVLSKRAVEKKWMPPDGQSALPESIRKLIPSDSRYWEVDSQPRRAASCEPGAANPMEGAEAQEMRDALVESKTLSFAFNKKGEVIGAELLVTGGLVTGTHQSPITNHQSLFNLLHRSWKGAEVIRKGEKGHNWIIFLTNSPNLCYHCTRNILLEREVSATLETDCDDEFFNFEGEIPAGHPANPLKRIPIEQELLDAGAATFLVNEDDFKKVLFEGDVLKGVVTFTKENGGIWTTERSTRQPGATKPRLSGD